MKATKATQAKSITYDKPHEKAAPYEMGRRVAVQLIYFGLGVLVSRGTVFGSYAPFGAALVAAAPYGNLLSVLGGAVLGCLLPSAMGESMRYLAAVIAAGAIRWALNDLTRLRAHALYAPLVALLPILATGFAMSVVNGFEGATALIYLTEGLLAAASAYFFTRTVQALSQGKGITALDQQEQVCAALTGCIVLLSFSGVYIGSFSIGRVLAVLAVLVCAGYGGISGGAVSGIAAGILFSLADPAQMYLAGAYAFGGLMAGLFSPLGRFATAAAFVLSNAVIAVGSGDASTVIAGLYEVMAASVVFLLLPKAVGFRVSRLFAARQEEIPAEGVRQSVVMRLDFAAKALADVTDSVQTVSRKLTELCPTDINGVYAKVIDVACTHCGRKTLCWEREYDNSMRAFNDVTAVLRQKGRVQESDFPEHFAHRCCKIGEVTQLVNRNYRGFTAREAADRRVREVRAVVSNQFAGMGEILADMARELEDYSSFDFETAYRIAQRLRDKGITPMDVSCRLDKLGRMTVEIEAAWEEEAPLLQKDLLREIARLCDRQMDTPCISTAPGCCRVQISERPALRAQVGSAQHVCGNGQLCGDYFDSFHDGMGRLVAVISDGMGTGGRAAVDGAMAAGILTKLAKAGLSYQCALRIVNSALAVKSEDESLATLDVASVDLFTGQVQLMKAGAPVSFVKKQDRVLRIDAPSLPAGILTDISFATEQVQLQPGDWLVMVSDGAIANGDEWLEEALLDWEEGNSQELADYLVEEAAARRTDGHDDDITAVAVTIH